MQPLPIIYINLEKDALRRTRMVEQSKMLGLSAQRLDAVYWADLDEKIQTQHCSPALNQRQYFKPLKKEKKG